MKELNNEMFPKPIGAYSNGLSIPIGDKQLIVLTGQQAIGKDGKAVFPNEPDKQTEFIFKRIESLLNEAGATLENIIKVVIYVTINARKAHGFIRGMDSANRRLILRKP